MKKEQSILNRAIEEWQPRAIIALFSGGYDSMIATHLVHQLDTKGLPIHVWSINTQLAADGWTEYVSRVAEGQGWTHQIYDNRRGFSQFVKMVAETGCPRTKRGHTFVYQKLKERAIEAIHLKYKKTRFDKNLFISGMRRAESNDRASAAEVDRVGNTNKIFVAPIVHWENDDCDWARVDDRLPDNPFYSTVKGSGDCQCNWGNFITLRELERYSPNLAAGNVKLLDDLSMNNHGFGWDGRLRDQNTLLPETFSGDAELTSPFLCAGCSRKKSRPTKSSIETRYLQTSF